MLRATNSPILRSTFWLNIQLLLQCTDTAADRCTGRQQCRCIVIKAVFTVKKYSCGWANLSPETCRVELKKINKGKSCCSLLVIYIVVLEWWAATQTSRFHKNSYCHKSPTGIKESEDGVQTSTAQRLPRQSLKCNAIQRRGRTGQGVQRTSEDLR